MHTEKWLAESTKKLESAGIGTARLDCLVLLEDALKKDRAYLLAHPEAAVEGEALHRLDEQIKRRAKHEPLAYIRVKTEFYGREFTVNKNVLEPRPESEAMIDLLKELTNSPLQIAKNSQFVDVGTGSGALAITAKLEVSSAEVIAIDIDAKCLTVARQNAKKHNAEIKFFEGNLIQPILNTQFTHGRDLFEYVILANLPYVPDDFKLNDAAMNEPKLAIFGGTDGLNIYRQLFTQLVENAKNSQSPRYVLTESLPFQHKSLAKIAHGAGYKLIKTNDFIQLFRIIG